MRESKCKYALSILVALGLLATAGTATAGPGPAASCGFGFFKTTGFDHKFFFDYYRTGATNDSYVFGPADAQQTLIMANTGTTDFPTISRELPALSGLRKWFMQTASPPGPNFVYGTENDEGFAGFFDGGATETLGLKRNVGGVGKYLLDFGDGAAADIIFSLGNFVDQTVVGFYGSEHGGGNTADGVSGIAAVKEVGVGLKWIIRHTDGTFSRINFGTFATDKPYTGDYDGDGFSDLTVVRDLGGGFTKWLIDLGPNWDGIPDLLFNFGVINPNTVNMVCDFTGDGADNVGFAETIDGENALDFTTKDDLTPGPGNAAVRYGVATDTATWGIWTFDPAP